MNRVRCQRSGLRVRAVGAGMWVRARYLFYFFQWGLSKERQEKKMEKGGKEGMETNHL